MSMEQAAGTDLSDEETTRALLAPEDATNHL